MKKQSAKFKLQRMLNSLNRETLIFVFNQLFSSCIRSLKLLGVFA